MIQLFEKQLILLISTKKAGFLICEIYIGDIAKGFNVFVPTLLAGILINIFVSIGYFFLIIPGIVISALYIFALPLIIEKNMDFWQTMETSRKLVSRNIFELSIFMLVLMIFLVIGFILLLVGFLTQEHT